MPPTRECLFEYIADPTQTRLVNFKETNSEKRSVRSQLDYFRSYPLSIRVSQWIFKKARRSAAERQSPVSPM